MANMLDYLDWRGDLTFEHDAFNEVDNLILSQMSYGPLEEAVTKRISVKEAAEIFFDRYDTKQLEMMDSQQIRASKVLEAMRISKRFQNCMLDCYVAQTDLEAQKQFAAITIDIMTDVLFIAFRGTDNTLVGWKEDLTMCYASHLQVQKDALAYFEMVAQKYPEKKFLLGGHSKGGNLAVYAAVMCSTELKQRIIRVYNNDGPGFRRDIIDSAEYQEILPKVRTIVPESSIVGMLLEHKEAYTVVRSSQSGGMQHDATSWEVLGRHFVYLDHTSTGSKRIDSTITAWLEDMTTEEMQIVVDALFSVLMAAGFSTVSAISKEPLKNATALLREMSHLDAETRKYILSAVSALVREGNRTMRKVIPFPLEEE